MSKIIEKIQKVTSKGQITLPVAWRKQFDSTQVLVTMTGNKVEISPVRINKETEYTVFDAIRDNKGKGIKAKDLVRILDEISR